MNETANETKKKEIEYVPAVREFDNAKTLITSVGFTAGAKVRYEILWPIPSTDEEAQERYDCTLADLITAGVRQYSTRPDYKAVGFDDDGNLKPDGHEEMQKLADGYKVGQRQVGTGAKAVVKTVKAAEKQLDMSLDEMVKKLAELKEQGLLD